MFLNDDDGISNECPQMISPTHLQGDILNTQKPKQYITPSNAKKKCKQNVAKTNAAVMSYQRQNETQYHSNHIQRNGNLP